MIIENGQKVDTLVDNTIVGEPVLSETTITFKGKNNILYVEDDVRIFNSNITFCSDNAVIYLSSNKKHPYKLKIDAWRGVGIFFGNDNYFNGVFSAIVSERQNLIVGNGGVFSFDIWIRTADPHILYDLESKKRINMSKSVLIGDHVWLGQSSLILKGTYLGSGSVLAGGAVISGKHVPSNVVAGGNPARIIRENIFFSEKSVHNYTKKATANSMEWNEKPFAFRVGPETFDIESLMSSLTQCKDSSKRLDILKSIASSNDCDARFAIAKRNKKRSLFGIKR